ncbi:protein NO VEIN domain-containing protein [Actinoplanes sp. NPDC048988]|uniref:protein NO VEIN domain-containing protein n=1 Tax=Actinoplanes sp. NPDC048988 TaxID=3363901 RepID=UPI00371EF97E
MLLETVGVLVRTGDWLAPAEEFTTFASMPLDAASEFLLAHCLMREPPLWLFTVAEQGEAMIPEDVLEALGSVFDPQRRENFLLMMGRKVDDERMKAIGAAGEEFVVQSARDWLKGMGRLDLAADVCWLSLHSDDLGYDVSCPDPGGCRHRLEVKTSGPKPGAFSFFLSRNEARTGAADDHWSLVAVKEDLAGQLFVAGWLTGSDLDPFLPTDHGGARWESVRIEIPMATLRPGLPMPAHQHGKPIPARTIDLVPEPSASAGCPEPDPHEP